ncbi:unnamed protein product [Ceratitis capitata]|uniref:(Mediterranean fruit fly) hypothetical protein n=1 Tax=Ceratitis capitata TaxID=7213 RepID=A0A811UAX0_CERCA|nr:unnamed protein product [Ceratitis capitata]
MISIFDTISMKYDATVIKLPILGLLALSVTDLSEAIKCFKCSVTPETSDINNIVHFLQCASKLFLRFNYKTIYKILLQEDVPPKKILSRCLKTEDGNKSIPCKRYTMKDVLILRKTI